MRAGTRAVFEPGKFRQFAQDPDTAALMPDRTLVHAHKWAAGGSNKEEVSRKEARVGSEVIATRGLVAGSLCWVRALAPEAVQPQRRSGRCAASRYGVWVPSGASSGSAHARRRCFGGRCVLRYPFSVLTRSDYRQSRPVL